VFWFALGGFSPIAEPVPPMRSSSSSRLRCLRPQIRQHATAMPPRRIAPPTPPTTPPITFFEDELSPELPDPFTAPLFRLAGLVTVAKPVVCATVRLDTTVAAMVWLPLTSVITVVYCWIEVATRADVTTIILDVVALDGVDEGSGVVEAGLEDGVEDDGSGVELDGAGVDEGAADEGVGVGVADGVVLSDGIDDGELDVLEGAESLEA